MQLPLFGERFGQSWRPRLTPILKPHGLESVLHFLEMEFERAKFFEFARSEMLDHLGVGFQHLDKVGIASAACLTSQVFFALRLTSS